MYTQTYFSQNIVHKSVLICVSEHLSFAEIIHPPHRCGISRCWVDSMIIAQVCRRLATIKDPSKMCSFTVLCVGRGASGGPKTSQYVVWPPFASRSATNLLCIELIRLLIVACGMLVIFNGCAKLLDIDRNWNMLSYTPILSIPNMLNGWHVRWVCWPCKNWDVFSFQELCTDSCNMGLCIIMLQHEVMNGTTMGLRISSQYLCAFKMPSIKCTCFHSP